MCVHADKKALLYKFYSQGQKYPNLKRVTLLGMNSNLESDIEDFLGSICDTLEELTCDPIDDVRNILKYAFRSQNLRKADLHPAEQEYLNLQDEKWYKIKPMASMAIPNQSQTQMFLCTKSVYIL